MKVLGFVALAALCWGCYGPLLHIGQMKMHGSRMRPFICVGLAYMVIAVIAPLVFWTALGADGELSARGVFWSLAGGTRGALGIAGHHSGIHVRRQAGLRDAADFRRRAGDQHVHQHCDASGNISSISPFFYAGLIVVVAGAVTVLVFAPRGTTPHVPATTTP